MKSRQLTQYVWLINLLLEKGAMTFTEIAGEWKASGPNGDGKNLPKRTFHDHREAIDEIFGIQIGCQSSSKGFVYSVSNPESITGNPVGKWLLESYCVPKDFKTYSAMKDRVILEEIPKGTEFVGRVIEAMDSNRELRLDYQPFGKHLETFHIQPYALKVYNRRWYIVGYIPEKKSIRNIALDRVMAEMVITKEHFELPKDFNVEKYYANTIGIYVNDEIKPEKVCLRVYGGQVDYLRSLPIHTSQKEVRAMHGEYSEFEYRLCITPELKSMILSMGENVEVLEPEGLRSEIRKRIGKSLVNYE